VAEAARDAAVEAVVAVTGVGAGATAAETLRTAARNGPSRFAARSVGVGAGRALTATAVKPMLRWLTFGTSWVEGAETGAKHPTCGI